MAKRRFQKCKPLESICQYTNITAAAAAVTRVALDFNLDDDELAELWLVDSYIELADVVEDTDTITTARTILSLDPSYPTDTLLGSANVQEDLETVFSHNYEVESNLVGTAAAVTWGVGSNNKQLAYQPCPMLLATNPAQLVQSDPASDIVYVMRIYFTRRKASGDDLSRILLKRR